MPTLVCPSLPLEQLHIEKNPSAFAPRSLRVRSAFAPRSLRVRSAFAPLTFISLVLCIIASAVMNLHAQIPPTVQIHLPTADTNAVPVQPTFTLTTQFPIVEESVRFLDTAYFYDIDTLQCDTCFVDTLSMSYNVTAAFYPTFVLDSLADTLWSLYEIPAVGGLINDTTVEVRPYFTFLPDETYTLIVWHLDVQVPQYSSPNFDTLAVESSLLHFRTDLPAFELVSVFPTSGAMLKCKDTIKVTFNRVVLSSHIEQMEMIQLATEGHQQLPISFSASNNPNDSTIVYILLDSSLSLGEHYTLSVMGSLLSGDSKDDKSYRFRVRGAQLTSISKIYISANGDTLSNSEEDFTLTSEYGSPMQITTPKSIGNYLFTHWVSNGLFDEEKQSKIPYIPMCGDDDFDITAVYHEIRPVSTYRVIDNPNLSILVTVDGEVVGGAGEYQVPLGGSIFIQVNDTDEYNFLQWNSTLGNWHGTTLRYFAAKGYGVDVDFWPDDYRVDKFPPFRIKHTLNVNVEVTAPFYVIHPTTANFIPLANIDASNIDISNIFIYDPVTERLDLDFPKSHSYFGQIIMSTTSTCWVIDSVIVRRGGIEINRHTPNSDFFSGDEESSVEGTSITFYISPTAYFELVSEIEIQNQKSDIIIGGMSTSANAPTGDVTLRYSYRTIQNTWEEFGIHEENENHVIDRWLLPCGVKVRVVREFNNRSNSLDVVQWKVGSEYEYPANYVGSRMHLFTMDEHKLVGHIFRERDFYLKQFSFVLAPAGDIVNRFEKVALENVTTGLLVRQTNTALANSEYLVSQITLVFNDEVSEASIDMNNLKIKDAIERIDGLPLQTYPINQWTKSVSGNTVTIYFSPESSAGMPKMQLYEIETTEGITNTSSVPLSNPGQYYFETEYPGISLELEKVHPHLSGRWVRHPILPGLFQAPFFNMLLLVKGLTVIDPKSIPQIFGGTAEGVTVEARVPAGNFPYTARRQADNYVNQHMTLYPKNLLNANSFMLFQVGIFRNNVPANNNALLPGVFSVLKDFLFDLAKGSPLVKNFKSMIVGLAKTALLKAIAWVAVSAAVFALFSGMKSLFKRKVGQPSMPLLHEKTLRFDRNNNFLLPSEQRNGATVTRMFRNDHDFARFYVKVTRID